MRNQLNSNGYEVATSTRKGTTSVVAHEDVALCSANIKKRPFLPKRDKKKVLKWLVRR